MCAASEVRRSTPETTTSTFLYDLLTRPGAYRTLWRSELALGDGALTAITDVLAEYLASQEPNEVPQNPQRLRRRVSQALAGQRPDAAISSMVLEWFIGAFRIDPRDADRLRFLHSGSSSVRYVRGDVDEAKLPLVDAPKRCGGRSTSGIPRLGT